ncbi:DUF4230 domain-containing protein [Solitalea koreensis]|uniref:DUF4230 domain-containing protein n=1 Tax=Solitalea koreensis TaxID=543615 RepID=A0A521D400_9SPHI|nr:DUF4230 domain-containing protein [Solitalea koreensis]SMO65791.1 Protein of unknown function [Solitalea koreensis]
MNKPKKRTWVLVLLRLLTWVAALALGLVFIRNCTSHDSLLNNHPFVVEKVQSIGKLELVKYDYNTILQHKEIGDWLPDPLALFLINGQVVSSVDFSKVTNEDVIIADSVITIRIPQPELLVKVDHGKSKIYETEYRFWDDQKWIDVVLLKAEEQLKTAALKSEIIGYTKKNIEKLLIPTFTVMGFKKVNLEFK